jgi:hypothetical protein
MFALKRGRLTWTLLQHCFLQTAKTRGDPAHHHRRLRSQPDGGAGTGDLAAVE